MGAADHQNGQELKDVVDWNRQILQTVDKIHDDLTKHDANGLKTTVSAIPTADLEMVKADYEGIYGKPLTDLVKADQALPADAKEFITGQLNRQDKPEAPDDSKYPSLEGTMKNLQRTKVSAWLGSNVLTLKQDQLLAQNGRYVEELGKASNIYIPFVMDNRANAQLDAAGGAQTMQKAESSLKTKIASYSPDELKAIDDYSKLRIRNPQKGVMEELANDANLSADTRKFIADLSRKAGVKLVTDK